MLYWEQLAWLNGAKSEKTAKWCCNISGRDASESRPAVSLQSENDDYEKKKYRRKSNCRQKKALQGHVGTVILGLLAVYGLNTLGTILSTNLFSGTSALDLVLSEVFMLVVSLIVGSFPLVWGICF